MCCVVQHLIICQLDLVLLRLHDERIDVGLNEQFAPSFNFLCVCVCICTRAGCKRMLPIRKDKTDKITYHCMESYARGPVRFKSVFVLKRIGVPIHCRKLGEFGNIISLRCVPCVSKVDASLLCFKFSRIDGGVPFFPDDAREVRMGVAISLSLSSAPLLLGLLLGLPPESLCPLESESLIPAMLTK
jgi:hypothetical protein